MKAQRWAALALGALVVQACSKEPAMRAWIDEDTAYLRCERVEHREQGLWGKLPRLGPPLGMLAGAMDPMSLEHLGFDRDSLVCASLQAPSSSTLSEAQSSLARLAQVRDEMRARVQDGETCACEALYLRGMRGLFVVCNQRNLDHGCLAKVKQGSRHDALMDRLQRQVEQAQAPTFHWRMVGRASQKAPINERYAELLSAFPGGTEVFVRRQAVPAGSNRELIEALLEQPKVVAVFRQARGQGLMVARLDARDVLVLDAFWYPTSSDPQTGLYGFLDNASIDRTIRALQAPAKPTKWLGLERLAPGFGWRLEPLQRVDEGRLVATKLDAADYLVKNERWVHPEPVAQAGWVHVDRSSPQTLEVDLFDVSEREVLDLEGLGSSDAPRWPSFVAADARNDFFLRNSVLGSAWIYGASLVPMAAARMAAKGVGHWTPQERGFRYEWEAHKLPADSLRTSKVDAFYRHLVARGGELEWRDDPTKQAAHLKIRINATNP